jgi:hypothetical protein
MDRTPGRRDVDLTEMPTNRPSADDDTFVPKKLNSSSFATVSSSFSHKDGSSQFERLYLTNLQQQKQHEGPVLRSVDSRLEPGHLVVCCADAPVE